MKKPRLQAEALAAESFPIGDAEGQMGTVQARGLVPTPPYNCVGWSKPTDCPCTPML